MFGVEIREWSCHVILVTVLKNARKRPNKESAAFLQSIPPAEVAAFSLCRGSVEGVFTVYSALQGEQTVTVLVVKYLVAQVMRILLCQPTCRPEKNVDWSSIDPNSSRVKKERQWNKTNRRLESRGPGVIQGLVAFSARGG